MLTRPRPFVLCASSAALFSGLSAQAQKPTFTKSVDEPGRTPYYQSAIANCSSAECDVQFAPVPAGFRLVVTYVSAFYEASDTGFKYSGLIETGSTAFVYLPPPQALGGLFYVISNPVIFYVEPGQSATLIASDAKNGVQASGSLTGYLVAIP